MICADRSATQRLSQAQDLLDALEPLSVVADRDVAQAAMDNPVDLPGVAALRAALISDCAAGLR
jgi:hypothetical protein